MDLSSKRGNHRCEGRRDCLLVIVLMEELSGVEMTKITFRLNGPRMEVALLG